MLTDSDSLVRGPIGHAQRAIAKGTILSDTPVAPIACLFSVLFILEAGWQIFPAGPPGFQKELHYREVPHQIVVNVDRANDVFVDGIPAKPDRLYEVLAGAVTYHFKRRLSTHIALVADKNAAWATIIKILDAGREAGDDDVDFEAPSRSWALSASSAR